MLDAMVGPEASQFSIFLNVKKKKVPWQNNSVVMFINHSWRA